MANRLQKKFILVLTGLALAALASLIWSLSRGSLPLSLGELWHVWNHPGPEQQLEQRLLTELRLPRALSAFAVGGLLALAGALMQTLLRNPLADPYVLGISGGAAVGALGAMLLGLGSFWLTGGSILGALGTMLLVFSLAHGGGSWTSNRLLLTGVVVSAGWSALISFMLAISPDNSLRAMMFWLMGDFSQSGDPSFALLVLAVGLLLCLPLARNLTLLGRGELQAQALGVNVARLRWSIYFIAALLTAVAVTQAGSIGFIGLVVPHLIRLLLGNDQRLLLPASVLLGGTLLLCADTLARTVIAPQQLPVGVITAMLGVPVFLYLLRRGNHP
ncbi:MAG: iron ABC transporter permease [Pseudomonadota bacterium]|nr:iron ABC transporter permease [Pseudomonadota bacterium]